jgi:hypothetical protein
MTTAASGGRSAATLRVGHEALLEQERVADGLLDSQDGSISKQEQKNSNALGKFTTLADLSRR